MAFNLETEPDAQPADGSLQRVAGRALSALLRSWPTVIAVLIVLHAYLLVDGICSVYRAPWCAPVPDLGRWFGSPSFHFSVALTTLVSSSAWAVGAAVLLPRLASAWPDGRGSDDPPSRFTFVALGRCLVIGLIFAVVASLASVPAWFLAFRDGGFSPLNHYWSVLSTVESLYGIAMSVSLAPVTYLMFVAVVHDGLPIIPAFAQTWDAITGWTSSVAAPLWLLQCLQPSTLLAIAALTLPASLFFQVLEFPLAHWLIRLASAVAEVFMLALALGLWRDVCGAPSAASA